MALVSVDLFTLDHYDSYTWRKEALFQLALENSHPNPCSGCLSHKAFQKKMGVEKDCMISIWWVMNKNIYNEYKIETLNIDSFTLKQKIWPI